MTSRLLGYMVARNEAGRYLDACLARAMGFLDGLTLYDDRSDDDTAWISRDHGVATMTRVVGEPSFLEHEGRFRAAAWDWFERVFKPTEGDWVLALDADEFLVSLGTDLRAVVDDVTARAGDAMAVVLKVPEVFDATLGLDLRYTAPMVRTDGAWGSIEGTRLFRYRPGGTFGPKAMGCGAEPTYVTAGAPRPARADGLDLLHLGYMNAQDRVDKHRRYTSLVAHGHAHAHIDSIVTPPVLEPWGGRWPAVWRGLR